jgi:hypothetical protein
VASAGWIQGIDLDVSTLADWGAVAASLKPLTKATRPSREAIGEVEDDASHRLPAQALARLHPLS